MTVLHLRFRRNERLSAMDRMHDGGLSGLDDGGVLKIDVAV